MAGQPGPRGTPSPTHHHWIQIKTEVAIVPAPPRESSFLHHRTGKERKGGKGIVYFFFVHRFLPRYTFPLRIGIVPWAWSPPSSPLFSRDSHSSFAHLTAGAAGTLNLLQLWLVENCFLLLVTFKSLQDRYLLPLSGFLLCVTQWYITLITNGKTIRFFFN